jgi:hypothetical protein
MACLGLGGWAIAAGVVQLAVVVSPWGCTLVLSTLVAWLLVDNYTLYVDLMGKNVQSSDDAPSTEDVHRRFIASLSVQVGYLTDRNHALTSSLLKYNKSRMASIHWNLLHHKAMSMYYMQKITVQKRHHAGGGNIRRASSENILH